MQREVAFGKTNLTANAPGIISRSWTGRQSRAWLFGRPTGPGVLREEPQTQPLPLLVQASSGIVAGGPNIDVKSDKSSEMEDVASEPAHVDDGCCSALLEFHV